MIKETRAELASILTEALTPRGLQVYASWMAKITSKAVFIRPSLGTYLEPEQGEYAVSMDVVIVSGHSSAATALDDIDDIMEDVIDALSTTDFRLQSIDDPGVTDVNGNNHMMAVLHIRKAGKI